MLDIVDVLTIVWPGNVVREVDATRIQPRIVLASRNRVTRRKLLEPRFCLGVNSCPVVAVLPPEPIEGGVYLIEPFLLLNPITGVVLPVLDEEDDVLMLN